MENKKVKRKISTILLSLFSIVIFILGVSIYGLQNYYFVNVEKVFNSDDSTQAIMVVDNKNKKLGLPDFSVFEGAEFNVLERGYWHEFDESDLEFGNDSPFERIVASEKGVADIK